MEILQEHSLRKHNTFGINASTSWFISYDSEDDLYRILSDEYFQECRYIHIGEGSNLLFLTNFRGIILRSNIQGIEHIQEDSKEVILRIGAGVIWDDIVDYCVKQELYGIQNLSLIPGQVGAAAIQNIGAYGVEIEQVIHSVEAIHRRSKEKKIFYHDDCQYSYRHSIFKSEGYEDWIITHVNLRLQREATLNTSYADIESYFASKQTSPTLQSLREAIIEIRQSKLPNTSVLGNAGSFFMNPVVSEKKAKQLKEEYPQLPTYPSTNNSVKLAAGWLIEQCGFKGYRDGDAGVYEKQALILVNHGEATGSDVARLATEIQKAVFSKFGVELSPEVRYIS